MEFKHLEKIVGLLEEEIPLPEGAKAIHPEVEASEIEEKVKNVLERHRNTDVYDSEVFKSTNRLIPQTKKGLERIWEAIKNKRKEMESEIYAKYTFPVKEISSKYEGYEEPVFSEISIGNEQQEELLRFLRQEGLSRFLRTLGHIKLSESMKNAKHITKKDNWIYILNKNNERIAILEIEDDFCYLKSEYHKIKIAVVKHGDDDKLNIYKSIIVDYQSIIEKNLARLPNFSPRFFELWSIKNPKVEQEDFEIGKPILNYFPYGADFSKEEIQIRNLYMGKRESSKKFLPEMDGFTSVSPSTSLETISSRLWFYKTQQLGKDNLKKKDKTMVRDILGKIGEEEELWFYPIYEVPIISKRKAKSRQKVLYKDSEELSKFKIDILEHKVPFESSGAFFFDGLSGEEIDRLFVDSYFKREEKSSREMDYSIEVIKTEELNRGSIGKFEIPSKSVDYKKFILLGAAIGVSPGIFFGFFTIFWLGLCGAFTGAVVGELVKNYRKGIVSKSFKELFRYFENYEV